MFEMLQQGNAELTKASCMQLLLNSMELRWAECVVSVTSSGVAIMSKLQKRPMQILLLTLALAGFAAKQAVADTETKTVTVQTQAPLTSSVTTVTSQYIPVLVANTSISPVQIETHTFAKYPETINLVVGQELLFKSHGAADIMTWRYHQICLSHPDDFGQPLRQEDDRKGYKAVFLASQPGVATLSVDGNSLFIAPWDSHPIHISVAAR
jgi:hypothetical protein